MAEPESGDTEVRILHSFSGMEITVAITRGKNQDENNFTSTVEGISNLLSVIGSRFDSGQCDISDLLLRLLLENKTLNVNLKSAQENNTKLLLSCREMKKCVSKIKEALGSTV